MQFSNVYSLFRAQAAKYGERPAFYKRSGGEWQPQTWAEVEEKVLSLACSFLAKGLTRGASVAILAGNIPEWTICDLAAISAGGVGVGIYPTSSTEQAHFVINHSESEFLIVDSEAQIEKIGDTNKAYPYLKEIFIVGERDDVSVELVRSEKKGLVLSSFTVDEIPITKFDEVLDFGRNQRQDFLTNVNEIGSTLSPDDTAIMVYTSGTTGDPKGAMLSHRYILNSVDSLANSVPIFEDDTALSYLPGCHVAERISGIYNRLNSGATAYFVDDLSRLYEYLLEVKPTVFASLPRFFEKVHASLVAQGKLSGDDLRNAFGGNVRLLTSGGAPLPAEIADFFEERGLPILQAYGLTEN
ncbi:MAG TPA: AMP-binding protein, partial [Pyrinomonadaceae bacterium]|nr:AMP-binding protein [Pyrinomonadaceae bacterium]